MTRTKPRGPMAEAAGSRGTVYSAPELKATTAPASANAEMTRKQARVRLTTANLACGRASGNMTHPTAEVRLNVPWGH